MHANYLSMNCTQYLQSNALLIICVLDLTSEDQLWNFSQFYLTHIDLFKIKYLGIITQFLKL